MFFSYKFTLFAIIALVVVVFGVVKEYPKRREVGRRLDDLHARAEQLDWENQELEQKLAYYQSDAYLEKEARVKLNLRKEGEVLVYIKKSGEETERTRRILGDDGWFVRNIKGLFGYIKDIVVF